jgi:hypothetical protein
MLKGTSVNSDPGQNHDTLGDSAQLRDHGAGAVVILELGNSHKCLVDWLNKALEDGHTRARQIRLLCLGRYQKELALFLETSLDKGSLFSDEPADLVAELNIVLDGGVQESIEFLNRFRKRLSFSFRFGLCGIRCRSRRRSGRGGVERRGYRLVQNVGIGGRIGCGSDVFKARSCSLESLDQSGQVMHLIINRHGADCELLWPGRYVCCNLKKLGLSCLVKGARKTGDNP